jgi:hypothetical protein
VCSSWAAGEGQACYVLARGVRADYKATIIFKAADAQSSRKFGVRRGQQVCWWSSAGRR